jgi:hypothetical protein
VKTVSLEDRFREFARQQEEPVRPHRGAYERNIESLNNVDPAVSKVLEAFCRAVGWGLKRNDCCDRTRGAVGCNYILEHPDFQGDGFVAVDVEVTWGGQSDPLETVTVYQGHVVGGKQHVRIFPSRVAIPFSALTEEKLAAALEQQSGDVLRRISQRSGLQ